MPPELTQDLTRTLQLKKYDNGPFAQNKDQATTPSEWFSKMFPEQASIFGCPFIELKEQTGGFTKINPLAPNIDFLASILGGDKKLGHKVVYMEAEMQFYYYDVDKVYRSVSEDKLGNLMRAYLVRCAEELPVDVHKLNLFLEFRSDKTIRAIVHRAKSILACDPDYFAVSSGNIREKGPELYERVARCFVEQVLERQAGETLLLTDAYDCFLQYLKSRGMEPVNRRMFKTLVPPVVKEEFDLGIRHDVVDKEDKKSHYGWQGLRAVDLVAAVEQK